MLKHYWNIFCKIVLLVGVLLSFFAILELLRAYHTLYETHPYLGISFLIVFMGGIIWSLFYVVFTIMSHPPVLIPPSIEDIHNASIKEIQHYCNYLIRYMACLEKNESVGEPERKKAVGGQVRLKYVLDTDSSKETLIEELEKTENSIKSLVIPLNNKAEQEIRYSVSHVMLGVTLSPYRAIDLIMVLYKNIKMVTRIVNIYNSRPRFREQISIFCDVMKVVATVNFTNMGSKLLEQLGSGIPFVGRFIDDVAQGFGAGVLTSVVGHTALDRCRAFRGWNERGASEKIQNRIRDFIKDIKDILMEDVLPCMRNRVPKIIWKSICNSISLAIDKTSEVAEGFVKVPVRASQRGGKAAWGGVVGTTKFMGKTIKRTGKVFLFIASKSLTGVKGTGHFVKKVLRRKKKEQGEE